MLPSFIQNTIPDSWKNKYPNLSRIVGVQGTMQQLSEDKNLMQLFNKFGYKEQNISTINYECPLYKYTGNKDLRITTMAKITFAGGTITNDEPVPYIESNVFGNNFYTQFAGVRPLMITMTGSYISTERDITSLVDSINSRVDKVNALANSIVPNGAKGFIEKYNKAMSSYNAIKGKVNQYINQAGNIIKSAKNVYNTIQTGDIDTFMTNREPQYDIARFIFATILLSYSRIPIDISATNITFPNMLLDNYNLEVPEGENLQTLNFTLNWKHISTYDVKNQVSSALKEVTQTNKSLGVVSGIKNAG